MQDGQNTIGGGMFNHVINHNPHTHNPHIHNNNSHLHGVNQSQPNSHPHTLNSISGMPNIGMQNVQVNNMQPGVHHSQTIPSHHS